MDFGLSGKVVLVTASSKGLGKGIARQLAIEGADVVISSRSEEGLRAAAEEIAGASGRQPLAVAADVRDAAAIERLVAASLERFGRIDILVNNAGINIPKMALDVTEEDWDRVLDVNLKGLFFMAQAVGRRMRDQEPRGGSIVNMASQMGIVGYTKRAAYCSSKAGAVNLSRVLAFEWAEYDIRVNAVCPTFVETPLTRPMFEDPAFKADVFRRIPLGRLATPEDVANAVVFLAGPTAAMITGHALLVDGGWTAV